MYAEDFEFDGIKLSDFGFVICNFDGSPGIEYISSGAEISFSTIPLNHGQRHALTGTKYQECLGTTFDIMKNPCVTETKIISDDEYRKLLTWLNRRKFLDFRFLYDNEPDTICYYRSSFNIQDIRIDDELYGLRLNMVTDKPFGYGYDNKYNYYKLGDYTGTGDYINLYSDFGEFIETITSQMPEYMLNNRKIRFFYSTSAPPYGNVDEANNKVSDWDIWYNDTVGKKDLRHYDHTKTDLQWTVTFDTQPQNISNVLTTIFGGTGSTYYARYNPKSIFFYETEPLDASDKDIWYHPVSERISIYLAESGWVCMHTFNTKNTKPTSNSETVISPVWESSAGDYGSNYSNESYLLIMNTSNSMGYIPLNVYFRIKTSIFSGSDRAKIKIKNLTSGLETIINNCLPGETININSEKQIITTDNSNHKIYNDFNFSFPKLIRRNPSISGTMNKLYIQVIKIDVVNGITTETVLTGNVLNRLELSFKPIYKGSIN